MHETWQHQVSEEWLRARQGYLTASEVKVLIPDYKRLKSGKIGLVSAQQFAKVYGQKMSEVVDPMSFGDMARGHWLEASAIREYNELHGTMYNACDDRIIHSDMGIAFSPDAMNVPQPKDIDTHADEVKPVSILEIKSYSAGAHYQRKAAVKSPDIKLDERWQVAMAMAVCQTIGTGVVCFYAPQCRDIFSKCYTRSELSEEISDIMEIARYWRDFKDIMSDAPGDTTMYTEQAIYDEYLKLQNDAFRV